ncbi:FHA domain-containing protein [Ruegeria sediminis]|uniref:FHA domain-containing protein n=1 Tax=Ruegeria sediminis TaxID=2583820 RepID=A0ABY2WU90_9RHOB|nr:FHA domain-containing protein [Ruegeria sediminis]TMV05585.1 FHA domain-containing protein [Ruegeria sediminis]
MFKYKSPLSRLLEGAGKSRETADATSAAPEADKPEPIADFNALRQALSGGNTSQDAYDDTDELIPEDSMPEFAEDEADELEGEEISETSETEEPEAEEPETAETDEAEEDDDAADQVVTLRVAQALEQPEPPKPAAETAPPAEAEAPAQPDAAAETAPEPSAPAAAAPVPQPIPAPAEDRRSRVKTTFLGFERPDTHVQDLMENAPAAKPAVAQATYPVGWLVITAGPGRGTSIVLSEGLMQIGRNDDQAIQIDFGDTGISRSSHAVIAYDPEDRKCYLGHGGKANLVRLNGGPVLSTVPLSNGDMIRISETTMRFVAFCDESFDWRDA